MSPDAERSDQRARQQAAIDELLGVLRHERRGDAWVGRTPDLWGPVLFGGIGLAITISAACLEAPRGARLHSVHAHFLRPVQGGAEIEFRNEVVKAGRTFDLHRVTASQDGRPVITMSCSFTADTDGYVYDVAGIPDDVLLPEDLPEEVPPDEEVEAWDVRWIGPSPLRSDGTREATHRHWFRLPRSVEDPHLHAALLGYATDWTGLGGRPLHLEGDVTGMISLDHAAWFHRPARVDDWLLQDVQCLVNAGGRGTLRGVIRDRHGRIVASMAQEMLLHPVTP
ncbi:MAG TPA: acyl-CoA thioesterase domain-containing protein [Acidimicrobiales bacterium]|nr:acyl-CoA thioesterase domain-containing protein [Acidimicrobiales bacterium]